ncbi:MAG: heavy metal translocating P-type ATPase, partial [Mariprofundaceae bacterium]|nr:heavy metal translocating P-type ATPase [Mariprofundaceae bacterium]
DDVVGGSFNEKGSFLYVVSRLGQDSVLAQMIETVRRAQSSKPEIARMVDKVTAVFVPMVLLIALCTASYWWFFSGEAGVLALVTAMSVLLIACPCALGLATPISMMVGMGKAAEHGILIRHGQALESAAALTTILFDKTGTLTQGKPAITDIIVADDVSEESLLSLAAAVEQGSEHVLGKAILDAAKARHITWIEAANFEAVLGCGVRAEVEQQQVLLGNEDWLQQHNVHVDDFWQGHMQQLARQAKTPLILSQNGQIMGLIAIADPIHSDAKSAMQNLQQQGLRLIMLTGDNPITAQAVAREVGISEVFAQVKPDEKAALVARLQEEGEMVGMVGDGINDAAALAHAHVGFAIAQGSDIAIESADIVLMRPNLHAIATSIHISAATLRNMRQNLWGALIYNSLAIPVAAGVLFPFFAILLNPMIAGAAMAMSSVTVVSNANRLRFFQPK